MKSPPCLSVLVVKKCNMKGTSLLLVCLMLGTSIIAQQVSVISPPTAPKPIGPYSHALMNGNMLFVSGQIAIDPATGQADTANIETEVRRVMNNLHAILLEAGLDWKNIMKTTIYCTDLKNFEAINKVYASFLTAPYPARECIQVVALPKKMHVEMSVVAMK